MMSKAPDHVFRALRAREPIFHRPEFGTSRRDFEEMTDPNFWEVGASGRVYSRSFVLEELEQRHAAGPVEESWKLENCECSALADGVYLFTYQLRQDQRISRRATLWRRAGDGWKAVYHQGTLVSS